MTVIQKKTTRVEEIYLTFLGWWLRAGKWEAENFLLADFVVSFACRLPCEARNAEVEGAELTTAILLVGLFKICQPRTNHCLTHKEAQIKVYH